MKLDSVQDWIGWAGIVIPLVSLAWAACFFVLTQRRVMKQQEFDRFFQVMDKFGQPGGSVASKMAAAYELRKYRQYAPVIIRLCEQAEFEGPAAAMLRHEMALTAGALKDGRYE